MSRAAGRLLGRAVASAGAPPATGWASSGGRHAQALLSAWPAGTTATGRPSSSLTTTEGAGGGQTSVARSLIVDTLNLVSVWVRD